MEKMSYKISSRATILIGREGVSRADGAIIELIKNTYDADAKFCYIAFDSNNDTIYILDNGTGMTRNTIESTWMLIGTDNKRQNFLSETKRVRSGEKGIGRFALDRLGSRCTMYTKHATEPLIYWFNDWNNFEEPGQTLDEVNADFEYLDKKLSNVVPDYILNNINELYKQKALELQEKGINMPDFSLDTGTMFVINGLRDKWNKREINNIISILGFLVPPGEQTQYFIFAQNAPDQPVEEIESEIIDDYDYKVIAIFDGENIEATVYRNEFDLNVMPKELFFEDDFKIEPYTLETFNRGYYNFKCSLSELTGNTNSEFLKKAKEVGKFQFQYIFMKLSGGEGNYYYKPVNSKRKIWMEKHGGIKIYRDNFVVRPYGDSNSKSYDWLSLDARKGVNPVAVSHKSGQWHVNNSQIQGTVLISRVQNYSILDKSSREGIIENDHFEVLINILKAIISIFEKDRSYIVRKIKEYKNRINANNTTKEQASELANKLLKEKNSNDHEPNVEKLAKAVKIYEEEREELISEIKLLRALATNGLMTTSMVHDLKTINSILASRAKGFQIAISKGNNELIKRNLQDLKNNDEFLHSWITVITTQSNKDRRRRLKKDMVKTIHSSIKLLTPILERKKVKLTFNTDDRVASKKIFETDFDSIIYNLIINSIESFEETKCDNREITIALNTDEKFHIHYNDNGHGLNESFRANPYDIFNYGTTSKFDANGNQIGTGLGMYIVASSVTEYNGTYTLTKVEEGFGLDITFPI